MEASNKEEIAIKECYTELFKHSTPSVDFEDLVENATINELGQKEIPFMDYEIDRELFEEIVNTCIRKYKITGYRAQIFKNTIYLGCSPKFSN